MENECRLLIIEAMMASGFLKDNVLGSGYTGYHDEMGNCCLAVTLKSSDVFDIVITKRA